MDQLQQLVLVCLLDKRKLREGKGGGVNIVLNEDLLGGEVAMRIDLRLPLQIRRGRRLVTRMMVMLSDAVGDWIPRWGRKWGCHFPFGRRFGLTVLRMVANHHVP